LKIQEFDRPTLKLLRNEIDEALAKVGQKYGVTFQGGNIRYTAESFKMQISAATKGVNGESEPAEVKDFKNSCFIYGMTPNDLGRQFLVSGESYKLIGYKPKNHKYPFVGQRADGKRFKFTLETVRRGLGDYK